LNLQRGYPKKEILEKDSPTLRISTGQSERDESSRTNEKHVIHPVAILKGDSWNQMEYEVRRKKNHKIQSLGKLKTTKSQGIEIKSDKERREWKWGSAQGRN